MPLLLEGRHILRDENRPARRRQHQHQHQRLSRSSVKRKRDQNNMESAKTSSLSSSPQSPPGAGQGRKRRQKQPHQQHHQEDGLPKLPACQLCHLRKVKCDNVRPRCAPCARSGSECTIADANGGPPISREYISELEQRLQALQRKQQQRPGGEEKVYEAQREGEEEAELDEEAPMDDTITVASTAFNNNSDDANNKNNHATSPVSSLNHRQQHDSTTAVISSSSPHIPHHHPSSKSTGSATTLNTTRTTAPSTTAVSSTSTLQGSGLSFITTLLTDSEWRHNHIPLLRGLAQTSRAAVEPAGGVSLSPSPLPPWDGGGKLCLERYLRGSHVQMPFLMRQDIEELFARVFRHDGHGSSAPSAALGPHDLYRVFMILAIGSIIPFRTQSYPHHPFGYFLSAMSHFDSRFIVRHDLSAIQDLLLVARFGIYYHIGTSIWDIIRLCMRMCIEQGLHLLRPPNMGLVQDQMRRRVFWNCYVLDRYSAATLNRPFAIPQSDIKCGLPVDANDDEIAAAIGPIPTLGAFTTEHGPSNPSETSVMLLMVRLRRISGRVQEEFARPRGSPRSDGSPSSSASSGDESLTAAGRIWARMEDFIQQLEDWRQTAPFFDEPQSLHQRQEWFDFLQIRETFHLVRRAVDLVPRRNGVPPRPMLTQCLHWAVKTIHGYADLYDRSFVTYTRSYFHTIITAGFFVLYYASSVCLPQLSSPLAVQSVHMDPVARTTECRRALARCDEILIRISTDLPDARHYVALFEALYRHMAGKLDRALQQQGSHIGPPEQPSAPVTLWQHDWTSSEKDVPHWAHSGLNHVSQDSALDHSNMYQRGASGGGDVLAWNPADGRLSSTMAASTATGAEHMVYDQHVVDQSAAVPQTSTPVTWLDELSLEGVAPPIGGSNMPAAVQPPPDSAFSWEFLNEDMVWNMGHYAYGDINDAVGFLDNAHFGY